MKLSDAQIARLEGFLERVKNETYPETPSLEHNRITQLMLQRILPLVKLPPNARILDVGCGQGVALQHFLSQGFTATGITLNPDDVAICRAKGYHVLQMDQSFLDFPEASFDFIWCRHCLEHSVFPFFTLQEFHRVLAPQGWLYVEVPAPDTVCHHQTNKNHYAVHTKSMWGALLQHAGYRLHDCFDINFKVPIGPDTYWAFITQSTPMDQPTA